MLWAVSAPRVGDGQRLHRVDAFARDTERRAARRDHAKSGECVEQASDVDRSVEHLLEVVEDEQRRVLTDRRGDRLDGISSGDSLAPRT